MSEKSTSLVLKYAVIGFFACLLGAFISQKFGYNDGSLQAYMIAGIAGIVGGAVGGKLRQRKGKTS
jgi:hypothetical protein